MFGLIRLPLLLCLAFVVGVFYERNQTRDGCLAAGGAVRDGLCIGATE